MLAQLIQALYNIVDSLFIGRFSDTGLTALSIIYPIQLLMIAIATGTGVGINTMMSAKNGAGDHKTAQKFAGVGTPLAVLLWAVFAGVCFAIMPAFARMSTDSEAVIADVVSYGRIVCIFSFGLFLESIWTKVLQAEGDMKTPMAAQIVGAIVNIVLDPLLIFGMFGLPRLGISGAAIATVAGQMVAALIVMKKGFRKSPKLAEYKHLVGRVFTSGLPNMLMQSAYTLYIFGLNMILATFCDQAVTALGLYYKWQTFFFIPLGAMQTCIVPVISYNYAARNVDRCKKTLSVSVWFGLALMFLGTLCFTIIPEQMLRVFSSDELVISIGIVGFRWIGLSFIPLVTSLIFPVFFQAVGRGVKSSLLTVIRTVALFVPLGYLFAQIGLYWFWLTFPVTETVTTAVGFAFCFAFFKKEKQTVIKHIPDSVLKPSHPGVIITIARQHGSYGKQIGRMVAEKLGIPFYYKEMTALAAQESGLDKGFIASLNKHQPKYFYKTYLSSHVVRHAMVAQARILHKIAEQGSCVIVGRAADHVLRDNPDLVRVFIHAPEDFRVEKVMEVYGDTREQAEINIKRSDKARANYYTHISGKAWGESENYDLTVDSSLGIEKAVEQIISFCKLKNQNN